MGFEGEGELGLGKWQAVHHPKEKLTSFGRSTAF